MDGHGGGGWPIGAGQAERKNHSYAPRWQQWDSEVRTGISKGQGTDATIPKLLRASGPF